MRFIAGVGPRGPCAPASAEPAAVAVAVAAPVSIPTLDGLRALAVTLVFLAHSGLERRVPGGLGVTVFFVLSGFLITTLLRREQARRGSIDLRAFFLRRGLRLMPPLVIVLALAAALSAAGWIGGAFSPGGFLAALLYAGNLHAIAQDFHGLPAGIGVVWSLAIEEHFYLLYPLLAVGLLRWPPRVAAGGLLLLCVAVLAWRGVLHATGASADRIGMGTDTRIDAILAGCALALARRPWAPATAVSRVSSVTAVASITSITSVASVPPVSTPTRAWRAPALAALCLAALLLSVLWRGEAFRETLRYTLQAAAVAGLLHLAVDHAGAWPVRWLDSRPLVYLGSISYTVYLAHHVILLGLARQWPNAGWWLNTTAAVLLTLAVAEPMRRWVERPCARWRQRLSAPRPIEPAQPAAPRRTNRPVGRPLSRPLSRRIEPHWQVTP